MCPVALNLQGMIHFNKGDYSGAFENWTKAAELGDMEAHFYLSTMYIYGHGFEKDRGKGIRHLEEAAIGGHARARYSLGYEEFDDDNIERAVKHWIISAKQGDDDSMKALMKEFKRGFISNEDLAATLRAHQAAVDATKSPQRDAAEEYRRKEMGSHSEDWI